MARFRKKTIEPGGYTTPSGVQVVDPARLRHWSSTVKAMRKEGIKVPLSWGHAKSAVPHSADDAAFWSSKLVAGEVLDMDVGADGRLAVDGDSPGVEIDDQGRMNTTTELPDGRKVRSSISEVSIGAMDWVDGNGKTWKDAPVHVAITPLPVWVPEGGQPGFEAVESKAAHFGTASLLYRFATEGYMADEKDDKDPPKKEPPAEGKEKDTPEEDAAPEVGLPEVLEALASIGLTLPESTTDMTLMRDIVVGCAAIAGAEAADNPEVPTDAAPPAEGTGGAAGGAFMSTLFKTDPMAMGLVAELEKLQREKLLARLDGFKKRGLPGHKVNEYREAITAVRFSTDSKGQPIKPRVEDIFDVLEFSLPSEEAASPYAALFGSTIPGKPEDAEELNAQKRDQAAADELARNGGLPSRQRSA